MAGLFLPKFKMSVHISSLVWKAKMPSTEKFILLKLADNANDDGVCWPSLTRICTETCLSRSTVCTNLNSLESKGLIERRAAPEQGSSTRYFLNSKAIAELRPANSPAGGLVSVQDFASLPARLPQSVKKTKVVRQTDPNHNRIKTEPSTTPPPGIPTEEKPKSPAKPKNAKPTLELPHGEKFAELWPKWEAYRKEIRKPLAESTRESQLKKLAGYSESDAVDIVATSIDRGWIGLIYEHHERVGGPTRGANTRKSGTLNSGSTFRSREPEDQGEMF